MRKEIDLMQIKIHLSGSSQAAKIIDQILGRSSILQDIHFCNHYTHVFYKWHIEEVIPTRTSPIDKGDIAMIGGALAKTAAMYLARAIDEGPKGRFKLDFPTHFKKNGLHSAYLDFDNYRNNEIAHYGGFTDRGRRYSDDRVILVSEGDESYFCPVYGRMFSSGPIVNNIIALCDSAKPFADAELRKSQAKFIEMLNLDESLRRRILELSPKCQFDPVTFWKEFPLSEKRQLNPHGGTFQINLD